MSLRTGVGVGVRCSLEVPLGDGTNSEPEGERRGAREGLGGVGTGLGPGGVGT